MKVFSMWRGSRTGESASSSLRASSLSAIPTKRASFSANCIKVEKDNGKTVTGRGTKVPAISPKPLPSVKSSSGAVKLSPSSYSFRRSLSSNSSSKHSPEIERRKIDSKSGNYSSTSSTSPTNRNQSMSSHISPRLKPDQALFQRIDFKLQMLESGNHSSGAVKTQLSPSSSSSSIDSFRRSLSSNSSCKHSPEIEKLKIDSKNGNYSSTSSTVRSTTRTAPTNRNQSMSSCTSPRLKSLTKPSSNISPAWKPF